MSAATLSQSEGMGIATMRRMQAFSGVDQLRLVATALVAFLVIDFVRLTLAHPPTEGPLVTVMDLVAYLALGMALWRPRLGLGLATIPLITALFWPSTSLEALILLVVTACALTQLGRRSAAGTTAGLVVYAVTRVALYQGDARGGLAVMLAVSLGLGLALGWGGLFLRERQERAERSATRRATENARIRADERRTLSRELHDVVAHQLSTASLQIMGAQGTEDVASLRRTLSTVDRATSEALTELRLLVRVLRDDPTTSASGTEIRELGERVPPTQAAAAAQLALLKAGFEPDVQVPGSADDLEMTVQRSVSRVLSEATENVIRHASAKSRCVIRVSVGAHQVTIRVSNPLPDDFSEASHGWGLRGLTERVALTGGTFSAGREGDDWVVAMTLPRG